jgi:glutamine synthetase
MDPKEIVKLVKDHRVDVIRMSFTDVQGTLKGLNISVSELERAMEEGIAFDGSSIEGFVRIEESDLVAMPDLDSFRLFPFDTGGLKSAVFICNVQKPDGTPFESDPRRVLIRALERSASMGFEHYYVGPELEYFYFSSPNSPDVPDAAGYFDILPLDESSQAREETLAILQALGMQMEATHHEVAAGQHEIDFRYGDALKLADQVVLAKIVIKHVARKHGLYATFMPKPIQGCNGSGMHVHQSLFTSTGNAFYSDEDVYNLSPVARRYIAGLIHYAPEMTAITNQTVNSYKRLVPGYEAPAYISWGRRNRSTLVRVPSFKKGKANSCRIEYRAPDPACNPYLTLAVMLQAGLDGINQNMDLCDPIEDNIFSMSQERKDELGIRSLPGDLLSATKKSAKSEFLKKALGPGLFNTFVANQYAEWDHYRIQVTDYELKTYLPTL